MDNTAKAAFDAAKELFGKAIGRFENVTWDNLPEPVKAYITAHPKATAVQIILAVVMFVPGLVLTPALGALGFTAIGPAAGK